MEPKLTIAAFPSFQSGVRARWAPLILEPIVGAYDRLVFGVAVVGENGFHIEIANALERLACFYGADAAGLTRAIEFAAENLKNDLASRGLEALTESSPGVSGVVVGECRDAEGASLEDIGRNWMMSLSSLYRQKLDLKREDVQESAPQIDVRAGSGDRLPFLILDYVTTRRDGLERFFSADIRDRRVRRSTRKIHEVQIDFSGSRVVANFSTLRVSQLSNSVGVVKQRLWELKVARDRDPVWPIRRQHEMIIQRPDANDPQFSLKQRDNVHEALSSLESQADQEELRLRALGSVAEIGDHVLALEAA
jgi:hypothetical protein